MGMYTELILGCELKKETPQYVIDSLMFIIGESEEKPKEFPFEEGSRECWLLRGGSYYFAVRDQKPLFFKDSISKQWVLSTRSNIKNYCNEIENFLEWLKPYIDSGSGGRDMYAIVTYEEQDEPTIHYLN